MDSVRRTVGANCADFLDCAFAGLNLTAGDRDLRARLRKTHRHSVAQPATAASDGDHLSREIVNRCLTHVTPDLAIDQPLIEVTSMKAASFALARVPCRRQAMGINPPSAGRLHARHPDADSAAPDFRTS